MVVIEWLRLDETSLGCAKLSFTGPSFFGKLKSDPLNKTAR